MAQQGLTAVESLAALAPIIGASGISGIVIAIFAYLQAARTGRRGDPDNAGQGISALLADSASMGKLVISIDRLALAMDKIALLTAESRQDFFDKFEKFIDEVRDLRRAVEDSKR